VAEQLERRVTHHLRQICPPAGEEIIDAEDFLSLVQQHLAQVRSEKSGATGDENPLAHDTHAFPLLGFDQRV